MKRIKHAGKNSEGNKKGERYSAEKKKKKETFWSQIIFSYLDFPISGTARLKKKKCLFLLRKLLSHSCNEQSFVSNDGSS